MKAILWDGQKQINGQLILTSKGIQFKMQDFIETDLDFNLTFDQIETIGYHRLYGSETKGIEILSKKGKKNVFVLDNPEEVMTCIEFAKMKW